MLSKPYAKISAGVLINLNYLIKIVRISDAAEGILFCHPTSGSGANQRVNYVDSATADAKFAEIITVLEAQAAMSDLSA